MSTRWLFRGDWLDALLGFAVGHVFSHGRIVAAQLKAVRVVLAILHRDIHMPALGAAELDHDPVAFLARHTNLVISYRQMGATARRSAYVRWPPL